MEGVTENILGQLVGQTVILQVGLYIDYLGAVGATTGTPLSLELVQESRGLNETEKPLVVAPGAEPPGGKRQVAHIGNHHGHLFQHPLGVVVTGADRFLSHHLKPHGLPRQPLPVVDSPGLLLRLIEIDLKAPGSVLLIQKAVRGGLDVSDRTLHFKLLSLHLAGDRVFDDHRLTYLVRRLQDPNVVIGRFTAHPLFHQQKLSFVSILARISQSVSRNPRVVDHILRRHQRGYKGGQAGLPRAALRPDDGRQRILELTGQAHQISQKLALLLTHITQPLHIGLQPAN